MVVTDKFLSTAPVLEQVLELAPVVLDIGVFKYYCTNDAAKAQAAQHVLLRPDCFLSWNGHIMPHITVSYFTISPTCSLPNTFAAYCITPPT